MVLQGRWLPEHTVYLDNRQMQGRPGFFVLTPLQLSGGGAGVVLVQRGWVARNFQDRTALASVETPQGEVEVTGRLALGPSRLLELAGADKGPGASRIRQNLDLATFAAETGLALAPLTVVQTQGPADGLLRQSSDPYIMVREAYFQRHDFIADGGKLKPQENPNAQAIQDELKEIDSE